MTITHDVPLERISDLLCSAFEGGSNYWYEIVKFVRPSKFTFLPPVDRVGDAILFCAWAVVIFGGFAILGRFAEWLEKKDKENTDR